MEHRRNALIAPPAAGSRVALRSAAPARWGTGRAPMLHCNIDREIDLYHESCPRAFPTRIISTVPAKDILRPWFRRLSCACRWCSGWPLPPRSSHCCGRPSFGPWRC